jgi:transposase
VDAGHDRARGGHPQALAHAAAINVATGQVLGDKTVQVGPRGFATLLGWAREFDGQRVWALEDCRHVSGALERFFARSR